MVTSRSPAPIVCFGEVLLRLSSQDGERLLQSPQLSTYFGGAEANVAAAISAMGYPAKVVTKLPDNPLGAACAASLQARGIDISQVCYCEGGRLGLYFAEQGDGVRSTNIVYDRAGSVFSNSNSDNFKWIEILHDAHALHLSGINLVIGDGPYEATLQAAKAAAAKDLPVSFDINRRPSLETTPSRMQTAYGQLRDCVTHLFASPAELSFFLGHSQNVADTRLTAEAFKQAFETQITNAKRALPRLEMVATSCRVRNKDGGVEIFSAISRGDDISYGQPRTIGRTVDRIGSGDAFAAACWVAEFNNMSLSDTAEFSIAAALLKRSVRGDVLRASLNEVQDVAFAGSQRRSINR